MNSLYSHMNISQKRTHEQAFAPEKDHEVHEVQKHLEIAQVCHYSPLQSMCELVALCWVKASVKLHKPRQNKPCDRPHFTESRFLDMNKHPNVKEAVICAAQIGFDPDAGRPLISKNAIKGDKYGVMKGIGFGGLCVASGTNRGYYSAPVGAPFTAAQVDVGKALYMCIAEAERKQIFPGVSEDTLFTDLASFITVNFSHAQDLGKLNIYNDSRVRGLLHRDVGDHSSTVLHLWQSESTPPEHRAHWFCESEDGEITITPLTGGACPNL